MSKLGLDKSLLAQIAKGAKYRSEEEASTDNSDMPLTRTPLTNSNAFAEPESNAEFTHSTVIPPTGREVKTKRVRVEANITKLWEGNPRNFAKKKVDNLLPLIQSTNGNTIPVFARYDSTGDIEIIAGSRRRECCIELNKLLSIDIIECSDQEADAIAFMENEGRLDVDSFSNGQFLLARFEMRKQKEPSLTIEQFANSFSVTRETMNRYLSIGRLPESFKNVVADQETFKRNTCEKLVSAYKSASKELGEEEVIERVERARNFKTAALLIHFIKKIVNSSDDDKVEKPLKWSLGEGVINLKVKKNGTKVIELDKNISPDILEKIETLLEKPTR